MVTAFGPTQQEREALLEGARRIAPQIRDAADEIEAPGSCPTTSWSCSGKRAPSG